MVGLPSGKALWYKQTLLRRQIENMLDDIDHEVWLDTDEIEEFIDTVEHSALLSKELISGARI